jgi:alpha-galactosidase
VGGISVDISALGKNEKNFARSERPFKHAGVANHPGDAGMAAIAGALLKALPK